LEESFSDATAKDMSHADYELNSSNSLWSGGKSDASSLLIKSGKYTNSLPNHTILPGATIQTQYFYPLDEMLSLC